MPVASSEVLGAGTHLRLHPALLWSSFLWLFPATPSLLVSCRAYVPLLALMVETNAFLLLFI